jgi:hypothetical protein
MDMTRISAEAVLDTLRGGERVTFVDARSEQAWNAAHEQIPGSIRVSPDDVDRGAGAVPGGAMVVAYCT